MKKVEFDEDNINKSIIEKVIGTEVHKKIQALKVNGLVKVDLSSLTRWGGFGITIDYNNPLTKSQINKCKKIYDENFKTKKEKVDKLIEKCDYVFVDLKSYIKLKTSFDEATYCAVESECEALIRKYLQSKASSYGVYRMRSSAFSKLECD